MRIGCRLQLRHLAGGLFFLLALCVLSSEMALAQSPAGEAGTEVRSVVRKPEADSLSASGFPSPGGAFLRSLIVPGWGQAAYGSYIRGGVYFAAEAGSWFMLLKTIAKLGEAKDMEAWSMRMVRDSLLAELAPDPSDPGHDPLEFEAQVERLIDQHPDVRKARGLVDARKEQREDWIVMVLFWALASGVDAFVNAHLSDFPARIETESRGDGGVEIGVRLPAGGGR